LLEVRDCTLLLRKPRCMTAWQASVTSKRGQHELLQPACLLHISFSGRCFYAWPCVSVYVRAGSYAGAAVYMSQGQHPALQDQHPAPTTAVCLFVTMQKLILR
jgi:hypothetical protein